MNTNPYPLITLANNVFRHSVQEHEEGIFSPRSGELVTRGTGYLVATSPVLFLDTDDRAGSSVFVDIVEFIADKLAGAERWATPEPQYLSVGFDPETLVLSLATAVIINDQQQAARTAVHYGVDKVFALATGSILTVHIQSPAARQFETEYLKNLARWTTDAIMSDPVGPLLHTIPSLSQNPWNTPYNRSHL
jgi:hypothetical protein